MTDLRSAIELVLDRQRDTGKPLAVLLAGHNGSGKSTMWRTLLSPVLRMPLINADRMMLSILPEPQSDGALVEWARQLRDMDLGWMRVAQSGVQAFAGHAMREQVPFAIETVFSYWDEQPDGTIRSKIDLIDELQAAGYFVLLVFVGLTNVAASIARVQNRVAQHGHDVPRDRLLKRFPKTQRAVAAASQVADATILTDNSRTPAEAFTLCRIQLREEELFDLRDASDVPPAILRWLEKLAPRT